MDMDIARHRPRKVKVFNELTANPTRGVGWRESTSGLLEGPTTTIFIGLLLNLFQINIYSFAPEVWPSTPTYLNLSSLIPSSHLYSRSVVNEDSIISCMDKMNCLCTELALMLTP